MSKQSIVPLALRHCEAARVNVRETPDLLTAARRLALRPAEAAKALGISARTLWGLTAPRGPIPCIRIGHGKRQTVLYPVTMLDDWMAEQAELEKRDAPLDGQQGGVGHA